MHICPYLFLNGRAEEAINFYHQVLGGELMLSRFSEMPDFEKNMAPEHADRVMHAQLAWEQGVLMVSDGCPSEPTRAMDGCAVSLSVKDVGRAQQVFDALADGGEVVMAWEPTFWAKGFGMLKDRFGVNWMVSGGVTG